MSDTSQAPAPANPITKIELPKESWNDTQRILAIMIVGAFIALTVLILFFPPHENSGVLTTLAGGLMAMAGVVANNFFGSTKSSQIKDQTIAALSTPPSS